MDTNDIKNLKAGQVVYLQNYPVTFKRRTMAGIVVNDDVAEDSDGNMCYFPAKYLELECFRPENDIKNTETAPKYDPKRKLKKGDIVEPCQVKGRWHSVTWEGRSGIHFTVTEDEDEDGIITIKDPDCELPHIAAAVFFNLVTPVEERVSFRVGDFPVDGEWSVWKNSFGKTEIISSYKIATHPNAKAAAEAERDKLNAEHRKEQK